MASPIAVPPLILSAPSEPLITERSSVGVFSTCTERVNATTPTRPVSGSALTSVRAAACAAVRRFGLMSVAAIEREVSMASTSVAARVSAVIGRCGRAAPTSSEASASSITTGTTCRRQRGFFLTRFGISAGLPKRATARVRRRSRTM